MLDQAKYLVQNRMYFGLRFSSEWFDKLLASLFSGFYLLAKNSFALLQIRFLRILFQNSSIFTFRPLSVVRHNCDMIIYANIDFEH